MNIQYPNYKNCIANLACSIMRYYGVTPPNATFPNQSAWLGWTGYFKEIDKNVVYFLNTDNDTGEKITDFNVARTLVPYESIREEIILL